MVVGIEETAGTATAGRVSAQADRPAQGESERGRSSRGRLIVPVTLALGWGVLLGYSTVLLTDETPVRSDSGTAQAGAAEPSPFASPQGVARTTRASAGWSDVSAPVQRPTRDMPDGGIVAPAIRNAALKQELAAVPPTAPSPVSPSPAEPAAYVGLWGPTEIACRRGARRRGYLPARITEAGAKAGKTVCTFRDERRVGTGWSMAASCSDGGRRWSSQVRLIVDGDRLTWSSARGDASYVRCGRRSG